MNTKNKRTMVRNEMLEGLKLRILNDIGRFPSIKFKDCSQEKNIAVIQNSDYTNVQGYKVFLKQKDGASLYEKNISDDYLSTLAEKLLLKDKRKKQFIQSFKASRDSIMNFDEMFFFHYHQLASSIKASYTEIARDLTVGKSEDEKNSIQNNLTSMLSNVDEALKQALNQILGSCEKKFQDCLKKSIRVNDSIDIKKLNQLLNQSIKRMKKQSDSIFKEKLKNIKCPILSSIKRTSTNAFGGETLMKSTSNGVTTTIQSTPITAHTKGMGPSMSKVTMEKGGNVLHQSYRTSHLVSDVTEAPETIQQRIAELVQMISSDKPVVYNLYTSVYNQSEFTGFLNTGLLLMDEPKNQQTQRLKMLLDAQDKYNGSHKTQEGKIDYSKLFFTFNVPTNGYGEEISLKSTDPLIHKAARSNIVAMAVMIFGKDETSVQELIKSYIDNEESQFNRCYQHLKTQVNLENGSDAKKFLFDRFKDDDAATHRYAKTTATCVGIISDGKKFTLFEGCKSGLERTGNNLGRVESYFKADNESKSEQESNHKVYVDTQPTEVNQEESEEEQKSGDPTPAQDKGKYKKQQKFIQKIHSDYNENGLYGAASCLMSLSDQGGNPKTSKTADRKMFYLGMGLVAASIAISVFCPPVLLGGVFGVAIGLVVCFKHSKSILPDTNRAEDRNILTNYESSNMSKLQAHKDKNFDGLNQSEIELMKENIQKQLETGDYKSFVKSDRSLCSQFKALFSSHPNSPEEPDASSDSECKV